jgi:hypothetical protein
MHYYKLYKVIYENYLIKIRAEHGPATRLETDITNNTKAFGRVRVGSQFNNCEKIGL